MRSEVPFPVNSETEEEWAVKRKRSPSFEHIWSRNIKTQNRQGSSKETASREPPGVYVSDECKSSAAARSTAIPALVLAAPASTQILPPSSAALPQVVSASIKTEVEHRSSHAHASSPNWEIAQHTGNDNNSTELPWSTRTALSKQQGRESVEPLAPVVASSSQQEQSAAVSVSHAAYTYHRNTHVDQRPFTLDAAHSEQEALRAKTCVDAANGTVSRLAYLKAKRCQPSEANVHDSYFFLARAGKAPLLRNVVVTEGQHVKTSLISKKLAQLLIRHGHTRRQAVKDNAEDQYVSIDLTWPFDTGLNIEGAEGVRKCFTAPQAFSEDPQRQWGTSSGPAHR